MRRNLLSLYFKGELDFGVWMTIQRLRGDQGADIKAEMSTKVKKQEFPGRSLIDLVLSWSITDVLDENLYEGQVCAPLKSHPPPRS